MKNPKTRNPKSETNPKAESRNEARAIGVVRILDFGFLSGFGPRISDLKPA